MANNNNKNNRTKPKVSHNPRQRIKTVVKKVVVKQNPTKKTSFEADFVRYFSNLKQIINFPTIIYLTCVFALYVDNINNPKDSSIKWLLTYLSKFQIFSTITKYLADHPTKLFSILIFGIVIINGRRDKYTTYLWFSGLTLTSVLMKDQPLMLYLLQTISVLFYMRNKNNNNLMNTLICVLPIVYYLMFVNSVPATNPVDASSPYENYTLPPIDITTQSPIVSRNVKDTST